jgi:hypothetical protein
MHFTRCNEDDRCPERGHVALAAEALPHARFVSRISWDHAARAVAALCAPRPVGCMRGSGGNMARSQSMAKPR